MHSPCDVINLLSQLGLPNEICRYIVYYYKTYQTPTCKIMRPLIHFYKKNVSGYNDCGLASFYLLRKSTPNIITAKFMCYFMINETDADDQEISEECISKYMKPKRWGWIDKRLTYYDNIVFNPTYYKYTSLKLL